MIFLRKPLDVVTDHKVRPLELISIEKDGMTMSFPIPITDQDALAYWNMKHGSNLQPEA